MSIFTNPADGAAEQAEAYVSAVLELLGDRDPMEVLESTPARLRASTEGLDDEELARPEAEGKWSVIHVLQHLADSELVWGYRLRRVLAEDRPRITGYDQDRWADRLRYGEGGRDDALETFTILRRRNLALLRSTPEEEMGRVGVHVERGEESVAGMIPLYAGHDLVHLNQVQRIVAGAGGGPSR